MKGEEHNEQTLGNSSANFQNGYSWADWIRRKDHSITVNHDSTGTLLPSTVNTLCANKDHLSPRGDTRGGAWNEASPQNIWTHSLQWQQVILETSKEMWEVHKSEGWDAFFSSKWTEENEKTLSERKKYNRPKHIGGQSTIAGWLYGCEQRCFKVVGKKKQTKINILHVKKLWQNQVGNKQPKWVSQSGIK